MSEFKLKEKAFSGFSFNYLDVGGRQIEIKQTYLESKKSIDEAKIISINCLIDELKAAKPKVKNQLVETKSLIPESSEEISITTNQNNAKTLINFEKLTLTESNFTQSGNSRRSFSK